MSLLKKLSAFCSRSCNAAILAAGFFWLFAAGAAAQSVTPEPTPTPDPMPIAPVPNIQLRPMPSQDRIGIENGSGITLTLERAIEMALENNNDIEIARKTGRIGNFQIEVAKGAYDPVAAAESYYERLNIPTASLIGGAVNGSVTQTRLFGSAGIIGLSPWQGGDYSLLYNSSRTTTSNTNAFLNPQFPASLTFSYNQPLFRGRRIDGTRRQIEVARKNLEISEIQLRLQTTAVVTAVEAAYWDLTFALRNLQVQTDTLRQAREQFESNRRQVERGVLAPVELVASNAQVAGFEQAVFSAQENITRAENVLKTLLLPDRTSPEWRQTLTPVTPVDRSVPSVALEIALSDAFRNRPELEQFEKASDLNKIDERFFRDQAKPQIDLNGSYTAQGLSGTETPAAINPATGLSRVPPNLVGGYFTSLGNLLAQDYPSYRVGVTISIPFRNRTAKANLGRTLVEGERLAEQRAAAEQQIEAEVRNALQALRSASARLDSAIIARQAAEELYASEERQFRAGTTTFYLVLQRQSDLASARGRELQSRTDLNKAIAEFNRATGRTLSVNNISLR